MLTQMSERMGAEHYGEERAETAEALAGGDDDDGGMDRRVSGDGHARLPEPSLVSPEEAGWGVNNIKN
jgi:hypothetical protein